MKSQSFVKFSDNFVLTAFSETIDNLAYALPPLPIGHSLNTKTF